MAAKTTPDTPSSDYDAMAPYWAMVSTILGGSEAVKKAGETYLPQFPNETEADYEYRRANGKFTNIYADILSTLSEKPFGEMLTLADNASDTMKKLSQDIDGRGNNLHVFASATFEDGINNAIDWILVDYTRARERADGRRLTLAEEASQGLRPYWVHVPATRMLAVYSDVIRGQEVFVHARMREDVTVRDGFGEVCVERVRVLDRQPVFEVLEDGTVTDQVVDYAPATFAVYEKRAVTGRRTSSSWQIIDSGAITLGVIALVPFITGKRIDGSWRFTPPMQGAADLQIEHYQQETALKAAKETVAFPMLAGNGVSPALVDGVPAPVPVGPKAVLYAPPYGDSGQHGAWEFVKIDAAGLKFLAEEVKRTEDQLRELGRQPLLPMAGITVVAAASASQKASSVLKSWALGLKDALEQALVLTAKWINDANPPTISWNIEDLDLDMQDDDGMTDVLALRTNGDLSLETTWAEMRRRGKLSADFDPKKERDLIEQETPDLDSEDDKEAALIPEPVG